MSEISLWEVANWQIDVFCDFALLCICLVLSFRAQLSNHLTHLQCPSISYSKVYCSVAYSNEHFQIVVVNFVTRVAGLGRGRTGMEIILHVPDGNSHSKLQGGGIHAHDSHVLVSFNSCIAKFSGAWKTTE
jgi:hypothetical protein